jgi:FAD/FMN-containing dehydrogenase
LFKYDFSYAVADMYSLVTEMQERLKVHCLCLLYSALCVRSVQLVKLLRLSECVLQGRATVIGYGHLGDGNLHLNIMSDDEAVGGDIEPFVYEFTQRLRGSISAEHGLGFMKGEKIGGVLGSTALCAFSFGILARFGVLNPVVWDMCQVTPSQRVPSK